MKKLLAVISLAFVVGVGVHAQQSETQRVIEILKQSKPKAAQTEQANSTEPLLAFRVYDKGIIFSVQGQPDQACEWNDHGRLKFTDVIKMEMKMGKGIYLSGDYNPQEVLLGKPNVLSCSFKSTPKSTLD